MRRFALALIVVGMAVGKIDAQADTVPFRQYSTPDGLPSKQITALAQTNNGLLWVGTKNGLVVCDGRTFRSIPMPDSVQQKGILALEPMPDGSVWAGVGSDVVRVAPHGVVQSHLLDHHNVVEILRRGARVRFVTHLAVWEQHAGRDSLARTPIRYEHLRDVTQVWGADLGPAGDVWIVNGERGPGRVQADGTVDFADPPPPPPTEKPRSESFFDLRFSPDGTALVARAAHLYRFDPEADAFTVLADTLRPAYDIHRRGRVAYLTRRANVLRYDTRARRFLDPVGAPPSLPRATTTAALRGREGGLWIGTQNAGLLHFPTPGARHVTALDGQTIRNGLGFERRGDRVWGTTWGDGLFQLRPQRRHVTPDGHAAWVLLRSQDRRLYGLTPSSEARGRNWYRWTPTGGWQFVAFAEEAVRGYVDRSGTGYFWHNQGLYRHVPSGDTTRRTRLRAWPLDDSQHHLMGPAPNGDLFLFDQGTVLRLRRPDGAVIDTVATLPEHRTAGGRRLTIDKKGRIWCPFDRLLRIDPRTGTTRTILRTAVENVQMAGNGLAMAKTNEGLYLIDANTGAVRRHLTEADGLLSNDVNGSLLLADTLYVGHPSGLTRMPADSLLRAPRAPTAVLTGLEVNLDDRPLPADSLLAQDERAVGFSYTGASFAHPDRVQYEVRLAPRDTAWSTTNRGFTRYTKLAPGTYRFEVRARFEGRTPGPAAAYTFTIPPEIGRASCRERVYCEV